MARPVDAASVPIDSGATVPKSSGAQQTLTISLVFFLVLCGHVFITADEQTPAPGRNRGGAYAGTGTIINRR